jgi:uncharacterized protein (DUF2236 family)
MVSRPASLAPLAASPPPMSMTAVSAEWLEQHLAWVAAQTSDPRAGIFGPSSISWRIHRESALFLAGGRAALLQLAHPWVAAALDQHSNLLGDPLARFHNTFRVVFTMFFGSLDQVLASSRYLYRLHTTIQGPIPETVVGYPRASHYQANEVNALLWVYATLIDSAVLAYESVLPPLTPCEREIYYAETKRFAALFGIPQQSLPSDWHAFEAYNRAMWASDALGVNKLSRDLGHVVLHGAGSRLNIPTWYRALTAAWMPERLREEFGLDFGEREKSAAARALRWHSRIYPRLPGALRFVGPYREACARLAGRKPGLLIQTSNRFWMGQPQTMFANPEA